MKFRRTLLIIVIFLLLVGSYGYLVYRKPIPVLAAQTNLQSQSAAPTVNLTWPGDGEAAVGTESQAILATNGGQTPLPTASVAKIITALTVLKAKPLSIGESGPMLTLTQTDVDYYNTYLNEQGSVAKVAVGEQISEYQALEAMLLPSANNMADTLAVWAYGSIASYSSAANALASSLGMANTTIGTVDASGFSPSTVSTAHDLVLLGEAALQNPVLAQIVAQPTADIPVAGTVHNVNWLLGTDGINGIKTGNTDQAGGVYLFSAPKTFTNGQSVVIVGVVMEPTNTLQQALDSAVPLLQSVQANFKLTPLIQSGQAVGTLKSPWGQSVKAVASSSLSLVTWQGQTVTPVVTFNSSRAPLAQGATVGTLYFSIAPNQTVPVVLSQAVTVPSWLWRAEHVF